MTTQEILIEAKKAKRQMAVASESARRAALMAMAQELEASEKEIIAANDVDRKAAEGILSDSMMDRLALNTARIKGMADGLRSVASLPDPLGKILSETTRPNALVIKKVSVPLGVVAIIYESRPNVTSDAAALCIMSGNACILRSGKEAWNSADAIVKALRRGLQKAGLPDTAVLLIEDTTRASSKELMEAVGYVDLLIPRGGAGLINACVAGAKVPCIQTGTGICHVYVDKAANLDMALDIIENAKTSRPSVCNAEEVCIVHSQIASTFVPMLKKRLVDARAEKQAKPVELRLDERAQDMTEGTPAGSTDFDTEFLDYILGVKIVDSLEEAIDHISQHSTGHSESIVTEDAAAAEKFMSAIDSAAVYVNASTRFTDGGEFGLGCEMGISTQKLHARGPMGLAELCSYKYLIYGQGQVR